MDDKQEFDVESIVQRIRDTLRHRRVASAPYTAEPSPEAGQTTADLADLHSNHDIYRVHFTSHRKVLGWLIVPAKRLVLKLLTPSFERQVAYNAANMRISSRLWEHLQETREQQAALQSKVEALAYQQGQLRGEIEAVGQRQESALQVLQAAVITQMDGWGQQQMRSLQALRDAISAQIQVLGQRLEDREQPLRELEQAMAEVKSILSIQERQLNVVLGQDKKPVPVPTNHGQF
jgi:hypothetical protein